MNLFVTSIEICMQFELLDKLKRMEKKGFLRVHIVGRYCALKGTFCAIWERTLFSGVCFSQIDAR